MPRHTRRQSACHGEDVRCTNTTATRKRSICLIITAAVLLACLCGPVDAVRLRSNQDSVATQFNPLDEEHLLDKSAAAASATLLTASSVVDDPASDAVVEPAVRVWSLFNNPIVFLLSLPFRILIWVLAAIMGTIKAVCWTLPGLLLFNSPMKVDAFYFLMLARGYLINRTHQPYALRTLVAAVLILGRWPFLEPIARQAGSLGMLCHMLLDVQWWLRTIPRAGILFTLLGWVYSAAAYLLGIAIMSAYKAANGDQERFQQLVEAAMMKFVDCVVWVCSSAKEIAIAGCFILLCGTGVYWCIPEKTITSLQHALGSVQGAAVTLANSMIWAAPGWLDATYFLLLVAGLARDTATSTKPSIKLGIAAGGFVTFVGWPWLLRSRAEFPGRALASEWMPSVQAGIRGCLIGVYVFLLCEGWCNRLWKRFNDWNEKHFGSAVQLMQQNYLRSAVQTPDSPGIFAPTPLPPSYDLFLSHAGEETRVIAEKLKAALHMRYPDLHVFVDDDSLQPADPTPVQAARVSNLGAFILSQEYVQKKGNLAELQIFLSRRDHKNDLMLPVLRTLSYAEASDVITKAYRAASPLVGRNIAVGEELVNARAVTICGELLNQLPVVGSDQDGEQADALVRQVVDAVDAHVRMNGLVNKTRITKVTKDLV